MKKLILSLLLSATLAAGCATTNGTPQTADITAGKSLLATQKTIVNIHEAFRVPCKQGLVAAKDCQQVESITQQSKAAYDAAVDAAILSIQTGSDSADYATKKAAFDALLADMVGLAVKYTIPVEEQK